MNSGRLVARVMKNNRKKSAAIFREDAAFRDSFFRGAATAAGSFAFIRRNRGLLKYFILPFLINILVLCLIWYAVFTLIYGPLTGLAAGSEWYLRAVRAVIAPLLILVLGIIIVLLYSILGSIITAPFNDFLSQRTEETLTGVRCDESFKISTFVSDVARIVKNTVKLLGLIALISLPLLALNLIPVAGSIAYSAVNFIMTSFFIGFQFFDFPLERRRYLFGEKMRIAWRFKRTFAGVGASFIVMAFVPVLGFLALNLGTIGAARLYVERIGPALRERAPGARTGA